MNEPKNSEFKKTGLGDSPITGRRKNRYADTQNTSQMAEAAVNSPEWTTETKQDLLLKKVNTDWLSEEPRVIEASKFSDKPEPENEGAKAYDEWLEKFVSGKLDDQEKQDPQKVQNFFDRYSKLSPQQKEELHTEYLALLAMNTNKSKSG